MALWLVRAGSSGEYENRSLDESKIYLTWESLPDDLSKIKDKKALSDVLLQFYPDTKPAAIMNWAGQIWPIVKEMKKGDWVALPSYLH